MRFGAAFWINRTAWPDLRDACLAAERAGWDSLWIDDHLLADEGDPADPKLEGWATLSALAVLTDKARLGLLVAANTFRNPGLTAKLAATVDHLSDGRLVLGLGGGWFEREHDAFGIDFGAGFGERLDRLDEAVGLIRRLLDGERVTHEGRFYTMRDALCTPLPVQPRLPILIGGSGPDQDAPRRPPATPTSGTASDRPRRSRRRARSCASGAPRSDGHTTRSSGPSPSTSSSARARRPRTPAGRTSPEATASRTAPPQTASIAG